MRIRCILPLLTLAVALNVTMVAGSHHGGRINVREKKVANLTGFRLSLLANKRQVHSNEPILVDL